MASKQMVERVFGLPPAKKDLVENWNEAFLVWFRPTQSLAGYTGSSTQYIILQAEQYSFFSTALQLRLFRLHAGSLPLHNLSTQRTTFTSLDLHHSGFNALFRLHNKWSTTYRNFGRIDCNSGMKAHQREKYVKNRVCSTHILCEMQSSM